MLNIPISNRQNFFSKRNFDTGFKICPVGILDISYTKSEQPRTAGKHLTRIAKNGNSTTLIHSNTLQFSTFFFGGAAPAFTVPGSTTKPYFHAFFLPNWICRWWTSFKFIDQIIDETKLYYSIDKISVPLNLKNIALFLDFTKNIALL